MQQLLKKTAASIQTAFDEAANLPADRRIPSSMIFRALRSIRELLQDYYGGPLKCRFSGYNEEDKVSCSDPTPFRVLEYLVDFSFSRLSIPQAIGDPRAEPPGDTKFELLFAAESELGTDNEVCRDLLKLLDTQSRIRCLLYRKRKRELHEERLKTRLLCVLRSHSRFDPEDGGWLFVSLEIHHEKVHCAFHTLAEGKHEMVPISFEANQDGA